MKVFELAKKLNKKSKEILLAAEFCNIKVNSHLSTLNDEEIREIISYFRKKRFIFFFKKYLTPLLLIFLLTILFFIIDVKIIKIRKIDKENIKDLLNNYSLQFKVMKKFFFQKNIVTFH